MPAVSTVLEPGVTGGDRKVPTQNPEQVPPIKLRCPVCKDDGFAFSYTHWAQEQKSHACQVCASIFTQENGIWNALPLKRQKYFSRFMADYEFVRKAEGRWSREAEFYLALPYHDVTGRNSWQWSIRSKTYAHLERRILHSLSSPPNRSAAILDLGAGNGWLCFRLARLGHKPIAVDLLTNEFDGLQAARHYRQALPEFFPRFQAELDDLPFADGQFDCAIFNASFHYSENYARTLGEAIRCLRPGGTVVIADSPCYERESSGERMKQERQESFQKLFGITSDGLKSMEYLTKDRLIALGDRHDLEWQTHRVWYGLGWASRPLLAKWRRRREPSQFRVYTARVKES
jgi:SAM-dependent methyltransferase